MPLRTLFSSVEVKIQLSDQRNVGISETEIQLELHSNSLSDMQPELQEIWQEQLDRVRRQQIIYREKVGFNGINAWK